MPFKVWQGRKAQIAFQSVARKESTHCLSKCGKEGKHTLPFKVWQGRKAHIAFQSVARKESTNCLSKCGKEGKHKFPFKVWQGRSAQIHVWKIVWRKYLNLYQRHEYIIEKATAKQTEFWIVTGNRKKGC